MSEQSLIIDHEPQVPATQEQPPANDLRHAMMTLPVERQNVMLAEYKARRDNFRVWLMQQMEQGVHYGVPPGCEPKGNPRKDQWQAQPSLYAAGADLLCDLLGLRSEFSADLETWQQLGSKPGYVVVRCRLYSRASGELIGEGRGARKEGQKGGDANNAVKMAQKSAKVDAVLNGYGLRDVFTQDLENPVQPLHDNPDGDPNVTPAPAPRGRRPALATLTAAQVKHVIDNWKARNLDPDGNMDRMSAAYKQWVIRTCDRVFNPAKLTEWTPDDYFKCCLELNIEAEGT